MIDVCFYNLLRSKYRITELQVQAGTIHEIINEIIKQHPEIQKDDFKMAIVFYHGKPIHSSGFHTEIPDNERIIFTHFVGGG
ncbi:MoaD/ThiS family protein [Candidatus Xianfuyuplasma coldseepsis]|uniref:MoaD/ThiS family protein n=1 Tax=Candidatus Xianfuyuplasma coldseepsis TaxID=2782163 RepID=A0A7L7KQQ1_9MOLU|nr:MoaD/ThiS family protein [Xianfuyuplasma coldseepsis]QMS85141.1 MoaD/ThiS family protein [Xianfuyuplasma coldseepsis]